MSGTVVVAVVVVVVVGTLAVVDVGGGWSIPKAASWLAKSVLAVAAGAGLSVERSIRGSSKGCDCGC